MSIEYVCSFSESLRTEENTGEWRNLALDKIKALKLNKRVMDRLELGQAVETA